MFVRRQEILKREVLVAVGMRAGRYMGKWEIVRVIYGHLGSSCVEGGPKH